MFAAKGCLSPSWRWDVPSPREKRGHALVEEGSFLAVGTQGRFTVMCEEGMFPALGVEERFQVMCEKWMFPR